MPATIVPFPSARPKPRTSRKAAPGPVFINRSAAVLLSEQLRMFRSAYDLLVNTPIGHQRSLSNHILLRIEMEMDYLIKKIAAQGVWVEVPHYSILADKGGEHGN